MEGERTIVKNVKNNKISLFNLILLIICILLGIVITIDGLFFNKQNTSIIEIYMGILFSLIMFIPTILLYLGIKKNKSIYYLFNLIITSIITISLNIVFYDIKTLNIILIIIGSILLIISLINLIKCNKRK